MSVMLGVQLGGLRGVVGRVVKVSLRGVGVMCGRFVIIVFVMFSGFAMMLGCLLMMLGCFVMVLGCLL